jgi:TonB-linked SusC/RagA family outer membrane protein
LALCAASGKGFAQQQPVTLTANNQALLGVFEEIERQTGLTFAYSESALDTKRLVSIAVTAKPVEDVLRELLRGTSTTFSFKGNVIVLAKEQPVAVPPVTLSGLVTDGREPLAGASIAEKGTTNGVVSDAAGRFSLKVAKGARVVVSFLGYLSQEMTVEGQAEVEVVLVENSKALDEVVVVGYGTVRKADLTTAVAVVSTSGIDERPMVSASSAIQGKAAGVQVIQSSGQPGSGMTVRIRGASSVTSSSDPLYVVDGVPVGDGEYSINYLSPNDIASLQVLKDASSAAIYGSRAANGVVLITTKTGANKDPKISFSAYAGISNVTKTYEVLNTQQYYELMNDPNFPVSPASLPAGLKDETDWFKETFTTGINQNYQLSYSGGNERSSYYFSGGYTDEQGILKVSYYKRYNFRANVETQVREWIKFSTNLSYAHYKSNGVTTGVNTNRNGVVLAAITTPRYAKIWSATNPNQYNDNFYGPNLRSPLENMANSENDFNTTDRLVATESATLNLLKGMTFKSTISMDRRWVHAFDFIDPIATSDGRNAKGAASDTRSDDWRMVYDNILTYSPPLGNKHQVNLMAGTSATTSLWEQLGASRTHFSDENPIVSIEGGNNGGVRGQWAGKTEWAIMSYLGRATYNYDSKYLFTANFRADGSSKLAPASRWGYFPSFSAAWRLSSEGFMKGIAWLDDLKLRGGWGQTGNQSGLDEYAYLQKYNTNYYDWTNPLYTNARPSVGSKSNMKNENLTWETTTQTGIGVDITVLQSRLTASFDAYYKYTTDMLMNVPLPAPNPSIFRNEGEMSNKGIELGLQSYNLVGAFKWNTDFNISFNKNKLEKLSLQQVYYYTQIEPLGAENIVRMTPGESLSQFWGYVAQGVDTETGDLTYKDVSGDGSITVSDKTYIGDANPDFTFGLTNNFSYKGFTLDVFINGSYGNDIFNVSRAEMISMKDSKNQITDVLRRWKVPGQVTDIPRAGSMETPKVSSYWVEDGSFLKVKTVTLSYNFQAPILRKWNIARLQPYVTLQNFFTLTNYSGFDPEVNQSTNAYEMGFDFGTYPNVKTVIFGVNIDF